jgi:3-oxoacyl-[acyl-carrier protein] reductase
MTETQNNGGVTKLLPAEGARILVAGGCGGMGRAFVAEVLAHGLQVAVLDLPVSLAGSPPPEGVLQLPCDALDEAQIVAAVKSLEEQWGSLRYLVNFIGFATERCPLESLATAVWDETINGTLRSAFILSRETLRLLRREQESAVVHFASTISVSLTMPGLGAYAAGKAGLLNLVRALALEWAPEIRVNAVAPGVVRTPFLAGGTGRPEKTGRMDVDAFATTLPLKRIGEPEDVVGPAMFLLSPAAGYITGQMIHVNGGAFS